VARGGRNMWLLAWEHRLIQCTGTFIGSVHTRMWCKLSLVGRVCSMISSSSWVWPQQGPESVQLEWAAWVQTFQIVLYGQDGAAALDWKKHRNVCYMFGLFFAVAMKESDNITQNPTCEWQLQLYSRNS
jgi:hypothetical protein